MIYCEAEHEQEVVLDDGQALAQFLARFKSDNVEALSENEWWDWVNSLPINEFCAMCSLPDNAGKEP